jgi:non-homologous end joining protein Ku
VLCQAMSERQRWAVGRMVLGSQRHVVVVRPAGTLFVLQVLHYPERVRGEVAGSFPAAAESSAELRLAGQLIDAASGSIDWTAYPDETAHELRTLVEAKLLSQPVAPEPAPVLLPLLEALQRSLADTAKEATPTPPTQATSRKRKARTP